MKALNRPMSLRFRTENQHHQPSVPASHTGHVCHCWVTVGFSKHASTCLCRRFKLMLCWPFTSSQKKSPAHWTCCVFQEMVTIPTSSQTFSDTSMLKSMLSFGWIERTSPNHAEFVYFLHKQPSKTTFIIFILKAKQQIGQFSHILHSPKMDLVELEWKTPMVAPKIVLVTAVLHSGGVPEIWNQRHFMSFWRRLDHRLNSKKYQNNLSSCIKSCQGS